MSVLLAGVVISCSGYDDSSLWKGVDEAQKQLASLNSSLTDLETQIGLLAAAKNGGVITSVTDNPNGGYTVVYTKADGSQGTAVIASKDDVKDVDIVGTKEENGVLYWTLTAGGKTSFITDADGAKIPVTGRTPSMSVDKDGYWMVNGIYVLDAGGAKVKSHGRKASLISGVTKSEDGTVTLVLADGSEVTVNSAEKFYLRIFFGANEIKGDIKVNGDFTILSLKYEVVGSKASSAVVRLLKTEDLEAVLDTDAKTVSVTLPTPLYKSQFTLIASDDEGNMITRTVRFNGVFSVDRDNDLWTVDTEEQLVPGCNLYSMSFKNITRKMYVIEVDLTNPMVEIATAFADDIVPNPNANKNVNNGFNLRETLSQLCARKTAEGENVLAGVNTGFFDSNDGIARGAHIENGELVYMNNPYVVSVLPNHSWAFTVFKDGTASCSKKVFEGKIEVGGKEVNYYSVNDTIVRGQSSGRMKDFPVNLYTSRYRKIPHPEKPEITNSLSAKALYVVAKYTGANMTVNDGWFEAEVLDVKDGRSEALSGVPYLTESNEVAIQAFGTAADNFAALKAGDKIRLSAQMTVGGVVKPILTQNSTMWQYITDGRNTLNTVPKDHSFYTKSDPMTFVCVDKSGTRVMIVEVDGRQTGYSIGVTAKEVTDIAFHLGAWNSTRFDGGGSSAVWAKTQSKTGIISSPSDKGGERSCMNYIYVRTK